MPQSGETLTAAGNGLFIEARPVRVQYLIFIKHMFHHSKYGSSPAPGNSLPACQNHHMQGHFSAAGCLSVADTGAGMAG